MQAVFEGVEAMAGMGLWANRRRRWWLRAQASRSLPSAPALAISNGVQSVGTSRLPPIDPLTTTQSFADFQRDGEIPPGVVLLVEQRTTGLQVRVPLVDVSLTVGHAAGNQLQLPPTDVAAQEAILFWMEGQLFVLDLSTPDFTTLSPTSPDSRWQWGTWTASLVGLPETLASRPLPTSQLDAQLTWVSHDRAQSLAVPVGISLLGRSRSQLIVSQVELPGQPLAMLVRNSRRIWLWNLANPADILVNQRPTQLTTVDSGDFVELGGTRAQLMIHWHDEWQAAESEPVLPAPSVDQRATISPPEQDHPAWNRFLLDQSTRLTQMRQRLADLSRQGTDAHSEAERETLLHHFRELAAECERDAAKLQAEVQVHPQLPAMMAKPRAALQAESSATRG